MTDARWWRWGGLAVIGVLAAVIASFNSGERVALNLGFAVLYQIPLVPLIFGAFIGGMVAMFLLGLRQDLRLRKALREAGFGEPIAADEAAAREALHTSGLLPPLTEQGSLRPSGSVEADSEAAGDGPPRESGPPPRYPP